MSWKRPWILFLLYFGVNLWVFNGLCQLKNFRNLITLSYPAGVASSSEFWQWMEKEGNKNISEAALWNMSENCTISSESTGREQKVSVCQMQGAPEAVFGSNLVEGRYFTTGEERMCLLDLDTAWQLFGSEQVSGLEVQMDGKIWRIAGVLKERRSLCVTAAKEDAVFDSVTIRKRDDGQSSDLAVSQVESILGSSQKPYIDGKLYAITAWMLWALMTSVLLLLLVKWLIWFQKGKTKRRFTMYIPILCSFGNVFLCFLSGIKMANPGSDYLPAYWSELEFYGKLFQEKVEQIQKLSMHQEFTSWNYFLNIWRQIMRVEMITLLSGIVLYLYRRKKE